MKTVYDVPHDKMIGHAAEKLKSLAEVKAPAWMEYVKTGSHKEKSPEQEDFWYIRCASLLRKVYVSGPVGVSELRRHYGSSKNRGVKPHRKTKASGNIIRKALQQLEKAGLIEKKKEGRVITAKGKAFMDKAAKESA